MSPRRPLFYDKAGRPIPVEQAEALLTDLDYKRVGSTVFGDTSWVSTVWLGVNHNWDREGPPILFETMVFGGEWDQAMTRYATEEQARQGHQRTVDDITAGRPLWFTQPQDVTS